ncbi:hypothetical protein [Proteiniphilum sp. X52]|uniref:hypothetical protein n=1 Tax=Proteiniphilum sp. X52 TaxID=2382159 RepID=UPI000F09DAD0|nr:hypothetical protein [Proteiniphilum sp. X52]RNC67054.1 hypothetical protein D7D25_02160 [Proteiniphilum sp. X52]
MQRILKNPAFGLMSMFIFSILVLYADSRIATGVALALSVAGYIAVKKYSRLIYDISIITFAIALLFSFTVFPKLPVFNRFAIVEIIFVISLIVMRLSRGKILTRVAKGRNPMLKNYLKESLRVAFQAQYGLSIHLLLVLAFYLFDAAEIRFVSSVAMVVVCQVIMLMIMIMETARLYILDKKLFQEEWLPVVTEKGDVTGKVAKSITKGLKNKFMHPVVRVALIYKGRIYLQARDQDRLLNPGKLDYPFEKYMQFNHEVDETLRNSIRRECGGNDIPLRFLLKYTFENEVTKRLVFLYVSVIEDEAVFNSLRLQGGKLWTTSQIEDNMGTEIFSECFELEYEYLKNTVLLAHQFLNNSKQE